MQEGPSSGPTWPRKLGDSVWEFCNPSDPGPTVEIIFFHGIQLSKETAVKPCLSTWTRKGSSTEYWPQTFFAEDRALIDKGIRVRALTAAYDASVMKTDREGRLELYLIAENFIQTIIANPRIKVGQTKDVPVILVAHSFGGLLVKELLRHARKIARSTRMGAEKVKAFMDNLAGVFFYSTPHGTLKDEVFRNLFPTEEDPVFRKLFSKEKNVEYSDLVSLFKELNREASRLENDLQKFLSNGSANWPRIQRMDVIETNETDLEYWKGLIVEEAAARTTDTSISIKEDHFDVCRPENLLSPSYELLANFILSIKEQVTHAEAMDVDLPSVPRTRVA